MDKSAIVRSIKENHRQWKSNDMMYIHYIVFDNGDEGEYFSKSERCFEFVEGQMASYSREDGFRNGKTFYKIKPIGDTKNNRSPVANSNGSEAPKRHPFNNNGSGKPNRNENAIMAQHAITKSVELVNGGKIHLTNLYPKALEILQWTHTLGNISIEEILTMPVEFIEVELEKGKGKRNKQNSTEKLS